MDMGTGKSRVSIELIHSTDCDYVLFLCPFSTKDNLQKEINKWSLKVNCEIMAYETLSMSDRQYLELLERIEGKRLFIVADESIFIKNDKSKRHQRAMYLAGKSEYRLLLNGTPITKNEWDLYNQMEFLSPKIIGMSRQQFLDTFFTKVEYKKKYERAKHFYKLSKVNIDYLHKLIEPYVFNVDLPFDKYVEIEHININASIETIYKYEDWKAYLVEKLEQTDFIMDALANLQLTMFVDEERCKKIAKLLDGQCIVYCNYLNELQQISNHVDCYVITGETPSEERSKIIKKFEVGDKPLLMTYGVGSLGLNLQFCNHIVFSSITFDYGKVEQAQARIKRLGQERDITYTYIRSNLGLYNMIEDNLTKKENLHDIIFEKLKKGDKSWLENI